MSIPVEVTPKQKREAVKLLKSEKEIIALDRGALILYSLIGLELLHKGVSPVARVVKGF